MMDCKKVTPNLIVKDVDSTLDFYERMLDFKLVMGVPEDSQQVVTARDADMPLAFALVKQGQVELMFQSGRSAAKEWTAIDGRAAVDGIALYTEVANASELYDRLKDKVTVLKDLHTTFYGMEEFYIRDCNGYVLGFASPRQERVA